MTDANVQYVTLHNDERDVPRVGIVAGEHITFGFVSVMWLDNDGAHWQTERAEDLVPVTLIVTGDRTETY